MVLFLSFLRPWALEKEPYADCDQGGEGTPSALTRRSSTSTYIHTIPFETVARGAWLGGGIKQGRVFVACNNLDLQKARTNLPSLDWENIEKTNFSHYIVIIIHSGVKPTGGYGIKVKEIARVSDKIEIKIDDEKYGGGIDAATIPYHILRIRRADIERRGEITFILLHSNKKEVDKITVYL